MCSNLIKKICLITFPAIKYEHGKPNTGNFQGLVGWPDSGKKKKAQENSESIGLFLLEKKNFELAIISWSNY